LKIMVVVNDLRKGLGITEWIRHYYNALSKLDGIEISIIVESGLVDVPQGYFDTKIDIIRFHRMVKAPLRYVLDWLSMKRVLEQYDFVHFHTDNLTKFFPLFLLRKKRNIIVHSHNSFNMRVNKSCFRKILHLIGKRVVKRADFIKFACSNQAAAWLFDDAPFTLVKNGINLSEYKFDVVKRQEVRRKLKIDGNTVVGHIGRFSNQKNHVKLINIFLDLYKHDKNMVLVLIGTGELNDYVRHQVVKYGIEDKVLFLGYQKDVASLLNAMDLVVFPSKYEGLPIALVEAQANGIPVFFSNVITSDVKLLPDSESFELSDSSQAISRKIQKKLSMAKKYDRTEAGEMLKSLGYSDNDVLKQLYDFYTTN